ncbi:Flavohemoprotein [Zhongshania aliphaticivorans]|uniref:Flavohemoprotein n=1 Tax=Zhongshania aliphaticivorans TaxID=1470434 RepID=A0A5S9MRN6_9GAMM|nr:globin domain-containing protein [Zhongshania aliphaticivorans]CAA0079744.1 Flavohemoprotein [Zhongshania aliphaticivorans]CAA0085998.1 Flavohemoprotein [Zhongshania aliphaticivorans]
MTPTQIYTVQSQLHTIKAIGKPFAKVFYARLFQLAPDLRGQFACDSKTKDRKLINTLCTTVNSLQNIDGLRVVAHNMAQRHKEQGINERHYDLFIQAMLETLEMALGNELRGNALGAWKELLAMLKSTLMEVSHRPAIQHAEWGREIPMALAS